MMTNCHILSITNMIFLRKTRFFNRVQIINLLDLWFVLSTFVFEQTKLSGLDKDKKKSVCRYQSKNLSLGQGVSGSRGNKLEVEVQQITRLVNHDIYMTNVTFIILNQSISKFLLDNPLSVEREFSTVISVNDMNKTIT